MGGVASPILSNIYLDRLDRFVERSIVPKYNRGEKRAGNPAYSKTTRAIRVGRKEGDREKVRALVKVQRTLPSGDPNDPDYRRLRYVRYADDFLLGFCGPKSEAEEIKTQLRDFLRDDLKLELSAEKTLITHASNERARFLGYDIRNQQDNGKIERKRQRRSLNGAIGLTVPQEVIERKRSEYMRDGKPIHRTILLNDSDYSIFRKYQAAYRGVVNYYKLAHNVTNLTYVHHTMKYSLLKTLAAKHKARVGEMARKHAANTETDYGTMRCLRVEIPRGDDKEPLVAEFGGIPLRRNSRAILRDTIPDLRFLSHRTDVVKRMLADTCEVCGHKGDCEVHHIRKLADLHIKGRREKPLWMQQMSAMRRKTLVVCQACHKDIHRGWPLKQKVEVLPESRMH